MALVDSLTNDMRVAADHLDTLDRPLSYDEFAAEIAAVTPALSDIQWMAGNQLVGIFSRAGRPVQRFLRLGCGNSSNEHS